MGWSKLGCTTEGGALIAPARSSSEAATHVGEGPSPADPLGCETEKRLSMIGRYVIRGKLGSGGMGRVYRAHDLELQRDVAIKVIRPTGDERRARSLRRRFAREGRALARLSNPYVVGVLEVGEQDGMPFLVMDYVPGRSLREVLETGGALRFAEAARIGRKLALALDHAHAAGILHRDVKPSNVIVRTDGEPLLIDFGLARDEERCRQTHLTRRGAMLGTPGFAPPEMLHGDLDRIGRHSDLYGLGATLYAMVSGEIPDTQDPTPLTELVPGVDRELAAICMECLAPAPEQRPASAKSVANKLARLTLLAGHAVAHRTIAEIVEAAEGRDLPPPRRLPAVSPVPAPVAPEQHEPRYRRRRSAPPGLDRLTAVLALFLIVTATTLLVVWLELNESWRELDRWETLRHHESAHVRAAAGQVRARR